MERNKLVLIALLCLAPLLGFSQTSRNPYTTNQNTGIIHNVVPIDGGGRDSTNWNTLGYTNALIGESGSVATFPLFTGSGSNVSLFLSTIINGTNYINGVLNASNSLGLFYDVVIGHSLVAPGPLSIYDDLTGTNLLFVTPSNSPTGNGMSLVSTNWVNPSIWNAVWSPVASQTDVTNAIRTVLTSGADGSGLTNLPVTALQTNIAGNPSSSTYYRGDGSWATPAGGSAPTFGEQFESVGGTTNISPTSTITNSHVIVSNGIASYPRAGLAPVDLSSGISTAPWTFTNSVVGGTGGTNDVFLIIVTTSEGCGVSINGGSIGSLDAQTIYTTPAIHPGETVLLDSWNTTAPSVFWKP